MGPDPFFQVKREQGNICQIRLLIPGLWSSKRPHNRGLISVPFTRHFHSYFYITTTLLNRNYDRYFTSEEMEVRKQLVINQGRRAQVWILWLQFQSSFRCTSSPRHPAELGSLSYRSNQQPAPQTKRICKGQRLLKGKVTIRSSPARGQ